MISSGGQLKLICGDQCPPNPGLRLPQPYYVSDEGEWKLAVFLQSRAKVLDISPCIRIGVRILCFLRECHEIHFHKQHVFWITDKHIYSTGVFKIVCRTLNWAPLFLLGVGWGGGGEGPQECRGQRPALLILRPNPYTENRQSTYWWIELE